MHSFVRGGLLAATALSLGAISASALAADAAAAADGAVADATSSEAQIDEASRGEVIIVTARRRQETAQAVPLAISVIKADSIESTGNFNVVKLQQVAAAVKRAREGQSSSSSGSRPL